MNAEPDSERVRFLFSPDPRLIAAIRAAVQFVAQQSQFTEAEAVTLSQAVEEALALIVTQHERDRQDKDVQLSIAVSSDRLEVVVENSALGGLLETTADAYLMTRGVDRVVEERMAGGGHRLTLVKLRVRRAGPPAD